VLTDPEDYDELIAELKANNNQINVEFSKKMAIKAFAKTAKYDQAIYNWFTKDKAELKLEASLKQELRYGENPHQKAKLYQFSQAGILAADQIQGKELSYNNIKDADSAYNLIKEFSEPAAAIIKHANPCGVAIAEQIDQAFAKALSCDPTSSFGGIIALNRELDEKTALLIKPSFYEVIITPKITEAAKVILAAKKNMRILVTGTIEQAETLNLVSIEGGILAQDADVINIKAENLEVVSKRKPTKSEMENLLFAFKAVKHVRSNAVLLAKKQMTIAIGAGQMSRVDSVRVASLKLADYMASNADFSLAELVLASDAFFPFPDGVELAAKAGVKAIIQPSGSIRDQEVIAKADELGLALVFAKTRHFKH
jgi:phosphoribosylaminoimidazolecarboxamide formyltransferase/IMP cyclohydrolase